MSTLNRLKLAPAKVTINVSGEYSKEIFELFIVTKMKLKILIPHLLIGRFFRNKCIFTDYNEKVFVLVINYFVL